GLALPIIATISSRRGKFGNFPQCAQGTSSIRQLSVVWSRSNSSWGSGVGFALILKPSGLCFVLSFLVCGILPLTDRGGVAFVIVLISAYPTVELRFLSPPKFLATHRADLLFFGPL